MNSKKNKILLKIEEEEEEEVVDCFYVIQTGDQQQAFVNMEINFPLT
jgi:hypothetical protein